MCERCHRYTTDVWINFVSYIFKNQNMMREGEAAGAWGLSVVSPGGFILRIPELAHRGVNG
jgi:hypothetical protein